MAAQGRENGRGEIYLSAKVVRVFIDEWVPAQLLLVVLRLHGNTNEVSHHFAPSSPPVPTLSRLLRSPSRARLALRTSLGHLAISRDFTY